MYGTHQLQLKRDTRVPRMCRPRNGHAFFAARVYFRVFYILQPRTLEKTHEFTCACIHVSLHTRKRVTV